MDEKTAADNVAAETSSPVSQVSVSDTEGNLLCVYCGDQFVRFFQRDCQRLLTKDRDAGLDAFHCWIEVNVVGGHNGHIVDPFAYRLFALLLDQLVVAPV